MSEIQIAHLRAMLDTLTEKRVGDAAKEFYATRYTPYVNSFPALYSPAAEHVLETRAVLLWRKSIQWLFYVWAATIIASSLAVSLYVVFDIIAKPSLPWHWSTLIVAYTLLTNAIVLLLYIGRCSPLPFRDYTCVMELEELAKNDPAAHQAKIRSLILEHEQRQKKRDR